MSRVGRPSRGVAVILTVAFVVAAGTAPAMPGLHDAPADTVSGRQRSARVPAAGTCAASAAFPVVPSLADVVGEEPVWNTLGPTAYSGGADDPVKVAWVLSRRLQSPVTITGRRLDGTAAAGFIASLGAERRGSLVFEDPHAWTMIPGGAEAELAADIRRRFSLRPSYVLFPEPGCWELIAEFEGGTVRTVHRVVPQPPGPRGA